MKCKAARRKFYEKVSYAAFGAASDAYRCVKRKLHHIRKGILSFLGACGFSRDDVIGDGADRKGIFLCARSVHIKRRSLHFNCHNAHFRPLCARSVFTVKTEGVTVENIT